MTFRVKIVLGILFISLLVSTALMYTVYHWIDTSEERMLDSQAKILLRQIETQMEPAIREGDGDLIGQLVRDVVISPSVTFVRYRNELGDVIAQTGKTPASGEIAQDLTSASMIMNGIFYAENTLTVGGQPAGILELGLDATVNHQLVEELNFMGFRLILPVLGLLGVLSYLLGSILTSPLHHLIEGADDIAVQGPGLTIPVTGNDEIAHVTTSFNDMSESLAVSYRNMNQTAERYKLLSSSLSERDALQSAMLSTALDAIVTIDGDGIVNEYNQAAEQIFGYSYEEAIGQEMAALIVPDKYREAHREGMRKWHETGEGPVLGIRLEIEAQNKKGNVFPIELAITPLNIKGKTLFTGFIRDITERKESEEELQAARSEAEAANAAKSRFLANMSHEIRTPLNAIINLNSLLLDSSLDNEQKKLATAATQGGIALSTLLDGILDFSKIEAGKMNMRVDTFSLHSVVRQLEALFLPLAEKTGLDFTTSIGPDVSEWVDGDETMLRQVLLNLIGNALKFTRSGSVRVTLESTGDQVIVFRVDDTGMGVPPEYVEHLFDEFSQADSSLTRKHGGTGLGLPISRSLVELMGGKINYLPRKQGGSTFQFSIPLTTVKRSSLQDISSSTFPDQISARVLVAEDSRGSQMVAEALLAKVGCEVRLANDGAEAVQAVSEEQFDVVLMDLSMPNMDGLEATRRIRAMKGRSASVPIIALTANAFTEDREECVDAGMSDFIAKPIKFNSLIDRIVHWVSIDTDEAPGEKAEDAEQMHSCESELMDLNILSSMEEQTSHELVTEIIGIFINETAEKMTLLREAGERQEHETIVAEAHAIKSSASTFGAVRLQEVANQVEVLGRQGRFPESIVMIDSVEDVLSQTLEVYKVKYSENLDSQG